jgi:hypothetical protein
VGSAAAGCSRRPDTSPPIRRWPDMWPDDTSSSSIKKSGRSCGVGTPRPPSSLRPPLSAWFRVRVLPRSSDLTRLILAASVCALVARRPGSVNWRPPPPGHGPHPAARFTSTEALVPGGPGHPAIAAETCESRQPASHAQTARP